MRIVFLILTALSLIFEIRPVFAADISSPTNVPPDIQIDQAFPFDASLTNIQPGEVYFVKCRIGQLSSNLTEGQTYNPSSDEWLADTSSWTSMPTVQSSGTTINFSITCKVKSSTTAGQKILYSRACLKKSDGTCGSGTGFQSSQEAVFTATQSPSSPTPTPSPTPAPTNSSSSFTFTDAPSKINFDQSFSVKITLSMPNSPDTEYYLKGAFKHTDSTRYFGLTKKGSNWIEYGDDLTDQIKITTDNSGSWSGDLEVKPDVYDNNYKGTGDYIFKLGRYTSGNFANWSNNETTIKIEGSSPAPTPTSTPNPNPSKSPTPSSQPKSPTPLITPKPTPQTDSIAGAATSQPSPQVEVKNQKQINPIIWAGLIFIFAGGGTIGYIYWKKKHDKIH